MASLFRGDAGPDAATSVRIWIAITVATGAWKFEKSRPILVEFGISCKEGFCDFFNSHLDR
jgi:hypothetical protein